MCPSENESEFLSHVDNVIKNKALQLLLFIDNRHSSQKNIEDIKAYLHSLTQDYHFQLEVLEISKHPHLVEYFKLVATPALVKVNPLPQQTLAGSNLTAQLQKCWYKWQTSLQENEGIFREYSDNETLLQTCLPSAELIHLRDDIFQLKQEIENLKQQIQFKDQMLAMLAHDLRSPLTAASIAVETLELIKNKPGHDNNRQLFNRLFQHTKAQFSTMNKMITDLLQSSKHINGQLNIVAIKVNLAKISESIINNLSPKLMEKNQKIIKEIPQDLPFVYADEKLISQVIINLLENAIKYSPYDAPIILSIIHKTTQKVEVSIIDIGAGIPDNKKQRIFDGHFRLKRDEKEDGYGIGLSLCRQVVTAHYGQIWVDNNGNQGSCFRFTLPVYN
ncbi:clock-associated two-component sensor histidine kinase SasA [Geminocystis sp. NIES-3708]|uniref:histidine kinase n=1 Tax=Geminocystis sp. NIES-3708 TaxID=1615909 RepID=UPI0005FC9F8A|nr:histidine kinase [Geminocystis sp. NIES-3708]BAQ60297.1 clock-associated two-component sensor histidine kinase SasA [Geminocystis sp. NIES-3708]